MNITPDLAKLAEILAKLSPEQLATLQNSRIDNATQALNVPFKKKRDWKLQQPATLLAWLRVYFPEQERKWDGWVCWIPDEHGNTEWPSIRIELVNIDGTSQFLECVVDVRKANVRDEEKEENNGID